MTMLHEADAAAQTMGMSRSRFFAQAVSDFLKRNREEQILRRLNEVYRGEAQPREKQLVRSIKAKVRPAVKDRW
jgi:metal-responsive CopG/Arc/MetJ family transcriptional regulator